MHSVGSGFKGDFGRAVEEDFGVRAMFSNGLNDGLGQFAKVIGAEVFFSNLDVVDVARGPLCDEGDECGSFGFASREQMAVGDGVDEHSSIGLGYS